MIALLVNGSPAPTSVAVGGRYVLSFEVDGQPAYPVLWSIGRRTEAKLTGIDKIIFEPDAAEPYYIGVQAVGDNGLEEAVLILNVSATSQAPATISITWSDPLPTTKKPLQGVISVSRQPKSLGWSLLFNNAPIEAGSGSVVPIHVVQPGIFRIIATAVDDLGNTVIADSSIAVQAPFGLQTSVVPAQPGGTLQYLGEVYSHLIEGQEVQTSYLPYELISSTHVVKLLPGTTHWAVDLDPLHNTVDDEVVVRTAHGNWTLRGPPTGLTNESLPYDYVHGQPVQPAALDLNARFTAEAWNVHGSVAAPFSFRLRIKCYRAGAALYRYTPCDWSAYYGGEGARQRRLVGLVTSVDTQLDAEWPDNRLNSTGIETFTVPDQHLILGQGINTGRPDRPLYQEDHYFTDQNALARYESPAGVLSDLVVSAAYGLPGVRPCYVDFSQPAKPRIIQKLKRLYGSLVLYVSGGAFTAGTNISVRIYTGKGPVDMVVPVTKDVYNPDYGSYARVASIPIDISDFEFDRVGILMDFQVNETAAQVGTNTYNPLHQVGDDTFYTGINSPAIKVDTACFRDPQLVAVFDGTFAGSAVPLDDCNRLACGPVGLYCYSPLSGGTATVTIAQPLGFPAPFVAYTNDQTQCYGSPILLSEITSESAGSIPTFGYTGTSGCGIGYRYDSCNLSQSLAVIYPQATSPHASISFGGTCWSFTGSVADLRPFQVVTVADVEAVTGCTDVICTGSDANGSSVLYMDQQANQPVTVQFHHLDRGIPAFGVAPERFDPGYALTPPGKFKYVIWDQPSDLLFVQQEAANVRLSVTPTNIWRDIVVERSGTRFHYRLMPGATETVLQLQAMDRVSLEFFSYRTQYRGKDGEVTWEKVIELPRIYDTAELTFTGSHTIQAVGFTGLTNRQDYTFYASLPADVQMDLPNPDSVVTIDDGILPEMVLVRAQAVNEKRFALNKPLYAGQRLSSPVLVRFYASRSRSGQHGEMDVWLDQDQAFPQYLKVSPFKVLAYGAYSYRKTSQFGDTTRRGLRVVQSPSGIAMPRVHTASDGERISVVTTQGTISANFKTYVFSGTLDQGISELIYWR